MLPVFASQVLYYFESNTRSATIIGIVGAGGIGQHLYEEIKVLEWGHVSFLVLLVLAAVVVIDAASARLRFAIIGRPRGTLTGVIRRHAARLAEPHRTAMLEQERARLAPHVAAPAQAVMAAAAAPHSPS